MNCNPLVSVGVITYNSRRYVLDTLESIRAQTYQNIELIISDDCSTDNTVDVCKEWVRKNTNRFKNVLIIEHSHNTGISANSNRAIRASSGEWYKVIAGDDLLLPDCIEKNISYIEKNPETQILFSQMIAFTCNNDGSIEEYPFLPESSLNALKFTSLSARDQYLALLNDDPVACTNAPTMFARHELLTEYPFNEYYKYSDDIPEWIKLTKSGVHIDCMDTITVKYRRGDTITSPGQSFISPLFWASKRLYFWNELEGYLREEGLYDSYNRRRKQLLRVELLEYLAKNKRTCFNRILSFMMGLFTKYVNYPRF